jgi:hypothetical protein
MPGTAINTQKDAEKDRVTEQKQSKNRAKTEQKQSKPGTQSATTSALCRDAGSRSPAGPVGRVPGAPVV